MTALDVRADPVDRRAPSQVLAALIAAAFLVAGVGGFVPGVTQHLGDLGWAGHGSDAQLLGVFQVSVLLNLVHLLFGVAGVLLARSPGGARAFLVGGGTIYLVLYLYGIAISEGSGANFVPLNHADNLLHLGLGLGMVALGVLPERRFGRPTETLGGFLASAAIFLSLAGVAYRPIRLIPFAIILALIASAFGGRHEGLARLAVFVCAGSFVLGLAIAVITTHPLW